MLNLVVADAELQLIPEQMLDDPAIKKIAAKNHKKPSEMLLDSNYMHTSIDKYFPGRSTRMGRPDIIYIFLEVAMESILNKRGHLRIYIHTKENKIIVINPDVSLPKSYNRFTGLIEDLFRKKEIKVGGKTLLSMENEDIISFLNNTGKNTVVLSPHGKFSNPSDIINMDNINVVIGGFSEGDYVTNLYDHFNSYSIFKDELTIWSVGMEIIAQFERFIKVL
ncbi:16S rRNA methyltransferase [Acidiplasma sp.]|uniref:16S rRNA methyltransferase n=1 Tax=Acidiplasma sp. TaxID=1872114 RepID=UPI002585E2C7|nr:16S rRNA methyltransferase [Acidiplasma sp.]